jgi:hypothetical protein
MSIDYTAVLTANYPGAIWTLNGDTYDGLTWLSDTPRPTQEELDGLWDATVALIEQEKADKQAARNALLARLGITEDEARMLLG